MHAVAVTSRGKMSSSDLERERMSSFDSVALIHSSSTMPQVLLVERLEVVSIRNSWLSFSREAQERVHPLRLSSNGLEI
ncbi:hypothetical protein Y032_0316g2291 [Ancylostoma ceylanicum]|nr:hypothetical protein Y032_0316g2291 [Ancylostoma ceylanicum]